MPNDTIRQSHLARIDDMVRAETRADGTVDVLALSRRIMRALVTCWEAIDELHDATAAMDDRIKLLKQRLEKERYDNARWAKEYALAVIEQGGSWRIN